ncbi:hypothetical protein DEO72_LG3g2241 [Vigna unguiculata]|uniref:CRAL-TRIO domain-containing protein n=1 Tax=Vigna unguiculata TaxID=3917 RepID=A0A4D6LGI9_VIGUN|nr:hypothetical protein DEO72_LG3g2241 [Vigna unguiculata]
MVVNRMISPFLTVKTKSKYIDPEQLPVKYGGLSKDGEFANTDVVTEITVRQASKHTVEFPVTEDPRDTQLAGFITEERRR